MKPKVIEFAVTVAIPVAIQTQQVMFYGVMSKLHDMNEIFADAQPTCFQTCVYRALSTTSH